MQANYSPHLQRNHLLLPLLVVALLAGAVTAGPAVTIQVPDLDGAKVAPLQGKGRKATVFFFVTNDCPITNTYAPEMNRLCAAYRPKHIAFYAVYADLTVSVADARKHSQDYGYHFPSLRDTAHVLVKRTGATTMPEAVVVAPGGKILYRGRIDDRYAAFGKFRPQPTTHDLRDALDAIVQGKPVPHPTTRVIGCAIPDLDGKALPTESQANPPRPVSHAATPPKTWLR